MAWSGDGEQVLFYSDRSGRPAFWVLDVHQGVPEGEPRLVMDNVPGVAPIGLSDKGFVYGTREGDHDVYIAEVDFKTGQILQQPTPVSSGLEGRHSVGDWSADGQSDANPHPDGQQSSAFPQLLEFGFRQRHATRPRPRLRCPPRSR